MTVSNLIQSANGQVGISNGSVAGTQNVGGVQTVSNTQVSRNATPPNNASPASSSPLGQFTIFPQNSAAAQLLLGTLIGKEVFTVGLPTSDFLTLQAAINGTQGIVPANLARNAQEICFVFQAAGTFTINSASINALTKKWKRVTFTNDAGIADGAAIVSITTEPLNFAEEFAFVGVNATVAASAAAAFGAEIDAIFVGNGATVTNANVGGLIFVASATVREVNFLPGGGGLSSDGSITARFTSLAPTAAPSTVDVTGAGNNIVIAPNSSVDHVNFTTTATGSVTSTAALAGDYIEMADAIISTGTFTVDYSTSTQKSTIDRCNITAAVAASLIGSAGGSLSVEDTTGSGSTTGALTVTSVPVSESNFTGWTTITLNGLNQHYENANWSCSGALIANSTGGGGLFEAEFCSFASGAALDIGQPSAPFAAVVSTSCTFMGAAAIIYGNDAAGSYAQFNNLRYTGTFAIGVAAANQFDFATVCNAVGSGAATLTAPVITAASIAATNVNV